MADKKKKKPFFRTLLTAVVFVALASFFILGCYFKTQSLHADERALDVQIQELEKQILDEKERQLDEKVQQAYYGSDAYKERIAREQFNLVYPGETIYVPAD